MACAHSRSHRFELLSIARSNVIPITILITVFSTFVSGLSSNLIKDYFYDFQLKPRNVFISRIKI